MRFSVTFLFISVLAVVSAPAEVIHLKNGKTIWADHVRENGAHLEYDVGDDSYAILKTSVDRIDAGGVRPELAAASSGSHEVPDFAPAGDMRSDPGLADKIIHDGK